VPRAERVESGGNQKTEDYKKYESVAKGGYVRRSNTASYTEKQEEDSGKTLL